jgi:nifR3 family TIM-barrel protein
VTVPFPTEYRVANVRIAPNIVLSPMEGVTDLTFRRLVRSIGGVGLTVTEFVPSAGLSRGDLKVQEMVQFDPDERPVAVQIFGRDPAMMAEGAAMAQDLGATLVDINMGCPSKKVCAHSGGSALMQEPGLVQDIVRATVGAVDIPVTVKMRSGFDQHHRNAPEIAWIAQEEGASAVAIHWRTRDDKYSGERAVDRIAEAKRRLQIPVLANGDIVDIASAERMFADTGCDGILVGRGAIKNPWLLLQISQWQRGEEPTQVDAAERRRVMLDYAAGMTRQMRTPRGALGRVKMLANQFTRSLPAGKAFRSRVLHSQSLESALDEVNRYFDRLDRHEAGDETVFEDYAPSILVRKGKAA